MIIFMVMSMKHKKWKLAHKALFLERLGTLMSQGYTLSDGIEFLKYHEKEHVQVSLNYLLRRLSVGDSFHEVLEILEFPEDVLGYLYFSEEHGDFSFSLKESGKMLTRREEYKQRLRKIVRYPLFMIWLIVILVIFMTQYLFPQFQTLYQSLELDFPWFTQIFLSVIHYMPLLLIIILGLVFLLMLFYFTRFRHWHPQAQMTFLMHFPMLRRLLPMLATQYFSVQLSCLLKGGLSVFTALSVFESQNHLPFFNSRQRL